MLVWCNRAAARRLAAEPLLDHPIARHLPRQDLQRHGAAQRDLLGLVHHPHPAPADLTEDPVVTDLPQRWNRGPGILGLLLLGRPDAVGLLHLDQRREQLADVVGQVRVAVDVFLERGAFAAAVAGGEFLGQLIEQVILPRLGDRHRLRSFHRYLGAGGVVLEGGWSSALASL